MKKTEKQATKRPKRILMTIRLSPELHRALKVKAAQEGRKIQDVGLEKFSEYVGCEKPLSDSTGRREEAG